jgi:hypothetical protein
MGIGKMVLPGLAVEEPCWRPGNLRRWSRSSLRDAQKQSRNFDEQTVENGRNPAQPVVCRNSAFARWPVRKNFKFRTSILMKEGNSNHDQ